VTCYGRFVAASIAPRDAEAPEAPPSLTSRFLTRRTVASIAIALIIVGVAVWRAPINWGDAWNKIRHADPLLYVAALAAYYLSFLVRSVRWRLLLENAGEARPTRAVISPIVISFFVNCVVPAKMGDVYRAYLARNRLHVSASKALGTVIAERLLDLCVLMGLLLAAGAIAFQRKAPGFLIPYVAAGAIVCMGGVGVILTMRAGRGQRILRLLPEAVFHRYEHFRVGTVDSLRRLPILIVLTGLVWGLESTRLALVVFSLGYGGLLGPSQFLLVALVAALLTTIPFLPGGLGLVEAGMTGVLIAVAGIGQQAAISITLLDRSISYGSLVVIGFIVFALTHSNAPRTRAAPASG
jgi:glycosyltransferase 2 family protein